jgi:hypothetical protein
MFRAIRRLSITVVAAVAVMGLLASQADAHECFNASRSSQANAQIAAHSHGWFDIQTWQLLSIFDGQCDPSQGSCTPAIPGTEALAGVDPNTLIGVILGFAPPAALGSQAAIDAFNVLEAFNKQVADAAALLGVPTHYVTLNNATAAGGAPGKVTTNGKGIDHFPDLYGGQLMSSFIAVFCSDFPDNAACA